MQASGPTDPRAESGRRERAAFCAVLAVGAAQQLWIAWHAWSVSPFARTPVGDGALYWSQAQRIASGDWIGDAPFVAAPLYPYVLGLLRAAHVSLLGVYLAQALLQCASAALIGASAAKLVRPVFGVVAAALFFVLRDVSASTARPLNSVLQTFTVAWVLWECVRWPDVAAWRACMRLGAALGVATLANPSFLALCFVLPVWAAWTQVGRRARTAAAVAAPAFALAGLATLHNWIAGREWIPLAAHGGLTFAHGNQRGGDGTYHAVEGVSAEGTRQDLDARATVRRALGREPTWREIDDHFYALGLRLWHDAPLAALGLVGRKLLLFLGARRYGDVDVPDLELEAGLADELRLAPLSVAWITLTGLVGLFLLARRSRNAWPMLALALLPLAVVAAFFYSPRYRLPAVPALLVGVAAWLEALADPRSRWLRRALLAAPLAVTAALALLLPRIGLDRLAPLRPNFAASLGVAHFHAGDFGRAEPPLREALAAGVGGARAYLAEILRQRGQFAAALALLEGANAPARTDPFARRTLAVLWAQTGRLQEARAALEQLLEDYPTDAQSMVTLGSVELDSGRPEVALDWLERAEARQAPTADLLANRGLALAALQRFDEADRAFAAALALDPGLETVRMQRLALAVDEGRWSDALALATEGMQRDSDRAAASCRLAWLLATVPESSLRDAQRALELAEEYARRAPAGDALALDLRAAALAAAGRFGEATELATRAAAAANALGEAAFAAEIEARASSYRDGRMHQLAPSRPPR